jgi:hypothetical protein
MKQLFATVLTTALVMTTTTAFAAESLADLEKAAKAEGTVNSVGMPDSWANWKDTWNDLNTKYGIKHSDTDMSSAQEIAKFLAEKNNASADIGDVGAAFGPVAVKEALHCRTSQAPGIRFLPGRKTKTEIGLWLTPELSRLSLINHRLKTSHTAGPTC